MSANDFLPETIGDDNIERLLVTAYRPEDADAEFARRVQERMVATAQELARERQAAPAAIPLPAPIDPAVQSVRRRMAWVLAIAAGLSGVALTLHAVQRPDARPGPSITHTDRDHGPEGDATPGDVALKSEPAPEEFIGPELPEPPEHPGPGRLTPRPRPTPPAPTVVAAGSTITTGAGERRRVVLPDHSVLYVNEKTTAKVDAERRVTLTSGEVFVEVAPQQKDGKKTSFAVQTPRREVLALGTRFRVRADQAGTDVLVTQGKVKVNGIEQPVTAGEELTPDSAKLAPAPRFSHVLDWTKDLMAAAESPLVPGSQFAGGALVALDPYGQESKLSLRKYHIDVHIQDGFARTTIDQTYFNHEPTRLEGTFYFPLPPDASLSRLAMYVSNGKECVLMEGGMAERDYARKVYETIMYQQRDPALLEWLDGSTFKMRVFPLEPRQEKRIILSYTQRLSSLYGHTSYRFPAGHNLKLVAKWSFHARVKGGANLLASSDSHTLKTKKDGQDLLIDATDSLVKADRDVVLDLSSPLSPRGGRGAGGEGGQAAARFSAADHDGARYLMLRYRPDLPTQPRRQRRDWVFLFESSADRDPLLARTQIEIIRSLLSEAEHDDTFALLTAGTRVHSFRPEPVPVTPDNVQAGLAFLDETHLIGALDLRRALSTARSFFKPNGNTYLVHVGSGIASMGEHRDDVLAKMIPAGVHYVGVGVGKRWARNFMKAAAERSGGYFTQINPDEPISWRSFELFSTLNTPRLLDVHVIDDGEKLHFLNYVNSLAQGEELCAIARLDGKDLPGSVTISGMLDGQPYRQTVAVKDVTAGADYLPRTWAKLEIDRLLTEDAARNKDKIVALSKAMYVMTPFTSLLVLENEEMYAQYKVDRGRKDHWAMYPCPAKIPIVYDPLPGMPADPRGVPANPKPTVPQVVQTVVMRTPPQFLNRGFAPAGFVNRFGAAQGAPAAVASNALPEPGTMLMTDTVSDADADRARTAGLPTQWQFFRSGDIDRPPAITAPPQFQTYTVPSDAPSVAATLGTIYGRSSNMRVSAKGNGRILVYAPPQQQREISMMLRPMSETSAARPHPESLAFSVDGKSLGFGYAVDGVRLWDVSNGPTPAHFREWSLSRSEIGQRLAGLSGESLSGSRMLGDQIADRLASYDKPASPGLSRLLVAEPATPEERKGRDREQALDALGRVSNNRGWPSLLYQKPSFSGDERVFFDLVAYCPGMNTSGADIQAIVEAEALPVRRHKPGTIDPRARRILDRAGAVGWHAYTMPAGQDEPPFALLFDGSGHYVYERTLSLGLRERVVCDGRTILHLYPELGIGARRTVSRFHRAALLDVVPWLLPPAEDLAHDADVIYLDDHTLSLVPLGAEDAKDDKGKPIPYAAVRLLFAPDGRLTERRIVEMPSAKVLGREVYDGNGSVRVLDGKDKELATRKGELRPAAAPDLKPKTDGLVVLPLPYRTRDEVRRAFHVEGRAYADMSDAAALALFAAEVGSGNGNEAQQIYRQHFYPRENRLLGFYTLMAAAGVNVDTDDPTQNVLGDYRNEPLGRYLAYHSNPALRRHPELSESLGPRDGFLRRLAEFRILYQTWASGRVTANPAALQQALDFVRRNKASVLGWSLLALLVDHAGKQAAFHRALADAWQLFEETPGLRYTARYERARSLLRAGQKEQARSLFRELYEKTLQDGRLPAIDGDFRQALQAETAGAGTPHQARVGSDPWGQLMRQTIDRFVSKKERVALLALAWQCWQIGDQATAGNLVTAALEHLASYSERLTTRLAAVQFLWQTQQYVKADNTLQPLLARPAYRKWSSLWRLAAKLAGQRGMAARSRAALEQALELEFQHEPDVINLQQVRTDYGALLEHYQQVLDATATLQVRPPADFPAKVIRAVDCWRALDRDGANCQAAGKILAVLGARDLAWEYRTTPIALHPNEAEPWLGLAQSLRQEGDLALADRAYAAAYEAEPTNAQILWDRAQNLEQSGKPREAQQLYRRLADGNWQPRFNWIQSQARWQLRGS